MRMPQVRIIDQHRVLLTLAVICCMGRGMAVSVEPTAAMPTVQRRFLVAHCLRCHDQDTQEGVVRLDDLPLSIDSLVVAERWQKVLNVLNAGEMPPEDRPQPEVTAKTEFLATLSRALATARRTIGDQGRVATLRRLNRREYQNTLLSLLDIDFDVGSLPDDKAAGSFDTIGSALFMSSDQFEQYLAVGRKAAGTAVARWREADGSLARRQTFRTEVEIGARRKVGGVLNGYFLGGYRKARAWQAAGADPAKAKDFGLPDDVEAKFRIRQYEVHGPSLAQFLAAPKSDEGAWLMWARGIYDTETITIPADAPPGDYLLRLRIAASDKVPASRRFLEMGIPKSADDFELLKVFQITGSISRPETLEIPVTITADGPRSFAFREKRHADPGAAGFASNLATVTNGVGLEFSMWIDWVEWDGPVPDPEMASRSLQLFGMPCPEDGDADVAREIFSHFAKQAFRGVAPRADYLDRLVGIYEGQRAAGKEFADAVVEPLAVILASPAFLYLTEPLERPAGDSAHALPDSDRGLSDLELAARLSYFLWAAPPDAELLEAAANGSLRTPAVLARQTQRLMADPRSFELAKGFTHQWLAIDRLDFFRFDSQLHPDFDEPTREAAKHEVYHTFHTLLRDNLDARSLLKSKFVVVNGLLATYYDLQDMTDPIKPKPIVGETFRPVPVPAGSPRGGLLGMAAILGMGSNGERTSPVERGAWVLRKLLNDPPPDAPPNVPQLSRLDNQKIATRERLRMHQEEPQCAQCHREIDPIGFGLENFDAGGKWRTEEHVYRMGWVLEVGERKVHGKVVAASFPIDPAGAFYNGPSFMDFFELRDRIADRGDDFLRGLIENLCAYSLGRPVSFADADTIDALIGQAKADGGRLASIMQAIVATPEFQTK